MAFNESRIHSKQSIESKMDSELSDSDPLEILRQVMIEIPKLSESKAESTVKLQTMLQVILFVCHVCIKG